MAIRLTPEEFLEWSNALRGLTTHIERVAEELKDLGFSAQEAKEQEAIAQKFASLTKEE